MLTSQNGYDNMVDMLLEHQATVDLQNKVVLTACVYAIVYTYFHLLDVRMDGAHLCWGLKMDMWRWWTDCCNVEPE